jgi:hypothetical protein
MKKLLHADYPLFPFLLSVYPVLYLWNANRGQQPLYVLIPILAVILTTVTALWLLAYFATRKLYGAARSVHIAALLVTVLSFFVLTYGHLDNLAAGWQDGRWQKLLLAAGLALVLAALVFIFRRGVGSPNLSKTLNLVAIALILFQVVSAVPYFTGFGTRAAQAGALSDAIPLTGRIPSPQRDVYFILVDNYGRQDVLRDVARFDNTELVEALKQRGFIFPDCAQGNYFWTAPVMSSILNMQYMDTLGVTEDVYDKRGHYDELAPFIEENLVIRKFRAYGYHTVTFRGFQGLIDIHDSDTYVSYDANPKSDRVAATSRFADLFYQTTLFTPLADQYNINLIPQTATGMNAVDFGGEVAPAGSSGGGAANNSLSPFSNQLPPEFEEVFQQNHYAYEALSRMPTEIAGPKFVYAHLFSAHWPFMLQPDGELRLPFSKQMTRNGYVDALEFTNDRLLKAIDAILANSAVPPVIILQGDHSNTWVDPVEWSGRGRVKILSAYYLPGGIDQLLYDTISPVNNFRLIFKYYFGEDIDLLPDVSHYLNSDTRAVDIAPSTCISDDPKVNPSVK